MLEEFLKTAVCVSYLGESSVKKIPLTCEDIEIDYDSEEL